MRIAVGSDHRGFPMLEKVLDLLKGFEQQVVEVAADSAQEVDYPDIAAAVAGKVSRGEADRGILICGNGLGMCIVANKFPGVRAAPCHDDWAAEVSRRHNDLNVLCLSANVVNSGILERLLQIWLKTEFEGGRHARRVEKIRNLEHRNGNSRH
jgi:ribose 5-phosphate isomerase B